MSILLDANVLCRVARPDDPQHAEAREAVRVLILASDQLIITPQVIREFWVVATRPREQNGLGMDPSEAAAHLTSFDEFCSFCPDNSAVYENWKELVTTHRVSGKDAHDANHVAAMQAHRIPEVLTFDQHDFRRYEHLVRVRSPADVLAQTKPAGQQ